MDRFSRNWYQNFANFSEMATSWRFLVLHPHPPTQSHIYCPTSTFMDQFSRNWYQDFANFSEMATSLSFLVLHPHPRTHPRNHTLLNFFHIYGSILSKLVSKFCKFFGDGDVVVFFSFTPPPTHPPTQSHIY